MTAPAVGAPPQDAGTDPSESQRNIQRQQDVGISGDSHVDAGAQAFQQLLSTLPENLRADPNISGKKSFAELAKDYANALPLLGRKGVILPKDDDPKDVARFLKELGRPDAPEAYDRSKIEIPSELPWDENAEADLRKLLHGSGVTQGQFEKLLQGYVGLQNDYFKGMMEKSQQHHEEQLGALRKELGAEFEPRLNLASRAMGKIFGEKAEALLNSRLADGTALGNNPDFIKGMIQVAHLFAEDQLITDGAGGTSGGGMTPKEAQAEIQKKESDPDFLKIYFDNKHPGFAGANAEMDRLYAMAYPEPS